MSLVVKIGSKQYVAEYGQKIITDRIPAQVDEILEYPLLVKFDEKGLSTKAKKVKVKILKHQKGKKISVLKFKSKSNYKRRYGFRPQETVVEILSK
jgi:large subunit ribosomal protein L21